ncbi:MAG: AraC family transcriptional regulator [Opitutus sp.]|nr:AraC family transcriptional regulator [Opitutus sp.]
MQLNVSGVVLSAVLTFGVAGSAAEPLRPPADGRSIRVAVVLTEHATMIDFAGPWEVFQDVQVRGRRMPFALYTVSDTREPIRVSVGMTVVPDHTFQDAPPPDVIVVGAQAGRSTEMLAWLRAQAARVDVLMSVCTGVAKLAAAGLLDGKPAATHHDFVERFNTRYPQVRFLPGKRFVQSGATILTAGGLTSGIDAALHVVERYFGADVAAQTAVYMEYERHSAAPATGGSSGP